MLVDQVHDVSWLRWSGARSITVIFLNTVLTSEEVARRARTLRSVDQVVGSTALDLIWGVVH